MVETGSNGHSSQPPRIGVYVCQCGTNIAGTVDVEKVTAHASRLPNVTIAKTYTYMCSDPGQALIKQDIQEHGLNRIVVASCSPLMHESTFRAACLEAGLNPYLFQMTNIREHVAWVHTNQPELATRKAIDLVSAAVERVAGHQPIEPRYSDVTQSALVVGAGIAGIEAALRIANSGKHVYLVEKELGIGGHMTQIYKTFPTLDCAA
ncbi:MAG: CoB--CoM heterodisulfide reductase iron-sulfur subunit A family protein [Anaerolineales bacterium]|nr:CoB--CoM heterodisulfide reductase iron-sulfur subunit A family protein [Anaerolineales bacterium]